MSNLLSLTDPPAESAGSLLLSARDLAALLRFSVRTIRTMDAAGRLPTPLRIGGAVRWRSDEILAWIAAGAPDRSAWAAIRAARK